MKRFIASSLLILLVIGTGFIQSGCKDWSSPNKVKRLITQGQWHFSSIYIDNVDRTNDFSAYEFRFFESGDITVIGDTTVTGLWSTDVNKNPTTLQLNMTPFDPFYHLNADWTFVICSKDEMRVELDHAGGLDVITMKKKI